MVLKVYKRVEIILSGIYLIVLWRFLVGWFFFLLEGKIGRFESQNLLGSS